MIFHCPYLQSDETRHSADCTKCRHKTRAQNLRDEAERVNVHYYEKLLPENHAEQMAVSYELRLPPLLGLQRDALKILARDLCVPEGYTQSNEMRGFWAHEDRLAPWLHVLRSALELQLWNLCYAFLNGSPAPGQFSAFLF